MIKNILNKIDTLTAAVIIFICISISALDFIGLLDRLDFIKNKISSCILLVFSLLGIYLLTESLKRKTDYESLFADGINKAIDSFNGVNITTFKNREEMFEYLTKRIKESKSCICDLSWGHQISDENIARTPKEQIAFQKYIDQKKSICSENDQIIYKEVMTFPTQSRISRAEEMLNLQHISYDLKYYECEDHKIPRIVFTIFDKEEVVFVSYRQPYLQPDSELRLSVRNKEIARLFQDYFETIWQGAYPLKENSIIHDKNLVKIKQRLIEIQNLSSIVSSYKRKLNISNQPTKHPKKG